MIIQLFIMYITCLHTALHCAFSDPEQLDLEPTLQPEECSTQKPISPSFSTSSFLSFEEEGPSQSTRFRSLSTEKKPPEKTIKRKKRTSLMPLPKKKSSNLKKNDDDQESKEVIQVQEKKHRKKKNEDSDTKVSRTQSFTYSFPKVSIPSLPRASSLPSTPSLPTSPRNFTPKTYRDSKKPNSQKDSFEKQEKNGKKRKPKNNDTLIRYCALVQDAMPERQEELNRILKDQGLAVKKNIFPLKNCKKEDWCNKVNERIDTLYSMHNTITDNSANFFNTVEDILFIYGLELIDKIKAKDSTTKDELELLKRLFNTINAFRRYSIDAKVNHKCLYRNNDLKLLRQTIEQIEEIKKAAPPTLDNIAD